MLVPALQDETASEEILRRRIFIVIGSLIGVPAMLFWAYLEPSGSSFSYLLTGGAVMLATTFVLSRQGIAESLLTGVAMAYICLLMLYMFVLDRGTEDLLWLLVVPVLSIFLFGIRPGVIWSLSFLAVILILGTGAAGNPPVEMLFEGNLDFLVSYIVIFAFSLCFEILRVRSKQRADEALATLSQEHKRLRKANEELDKLERRLVQYNHVATDWLYEVDGDYRFVFLSKRFEQILQIPPENVLGLSIFELLDNYDDCDREAHRRRLLNKEPFKDFRYSLQLQDGDRRYFMTRGEPLFDRSGEFAGYIGSGTDVTEYERTQIELRRRDQRLQHVQRLDAIGQLTSGIAHDFNNLLMVINGNSELLASGVEDDDNELLSAISTAARQGSELTAKLLSFSRDRPLQAEAVEVSEVYGEVMSLLNRSLGDGIKLKGELEDQLPRIEVDRSQLESALVNLAINGRDAMQGNGLLQLSVRSSMLNDTSGVEFAVSDEGEGIAADMIDRIIEPFFTTKPQGKGTGLGLSMVYGFAKQSGGDLLIESTLGEGTSVKLWLPLSADTAAPEAEAQGDPLLPLKSIRVLVVEDDHRVRDIVLRMMRVLNQRVEVCESGEEALQKISDRQSEQSVQLVLTDVMLGSGIDGAVLASEIRSRHPDVAIVLMSGYPEKIAATEAADQFPLLQKPFGIRALAEELAAAQRRADTDAD